MSLFKFLENMLGFNKPSISLEPSLAQQKINRQITEHFTEEILKSGYFRTDKLDALIEKVKAAGNANVFSYDVCLTLDEKKAANLNTRQKWSKEMFDCLTSKALEQDDPKSLLDDLYHSSFHKVYRKNEIESIKQSGIKRVKILFCDDGRDCLLVKKHHNKSWPIDEVPELPLPGCTAKYCRCSYVIDEKALFD